MIGVHEAGKESSPAGRWNVTQRTRWIGWVVMAVLLTGTAVAQRADSKFVVHEGKVPEDAVMVGYVQIFSHTALTVQDRKNPYNLKTFSLSQDLREKYREQHLEYGDRVKVRYRLQGGEAVSIHAHWRKGS